MPGRPRLHRKSQVYKRMMANRAKGIVEEKVDKEPKVDSVKPKKEKKDKSKLEKVTEIFKEDKEEE